MTTELFLGPLDLIGQTDDSLFRIEALSTDAGTSWGNAATVDVEMKSFLQHGSLVETEGWENRTLVVVVSAQGLTGSDDTGDAERALMSQLHRQNLLTYKPETATVRTVFRVLTSTLVPADDDFLETDAEIVYQIRLTCQPFARGADLITVEALPPVTDDDEITETIETVTTGATGWTGFAVVTSGGSPSPYVTNVHVESDGVALQLLLGGSFLPDDTTMVLQKTYPTVDTSDVQYMSVDWQPSMSTAGAGAVVTLTGGAFFSALAFSTTISPDDPTFNRSHFDISGFASFDTFDFRINVPSGGYPPVLQVKVGKIVVTNKFSVDTPRQQLRRLDLHGTMPTTGSLEVAHETEGLGEVLLYTCRGDSGAYTPACRIYLQPRTDDSVADTDAVSGSYDPLMNNEPSSYAIPNSALPDGDYTILASVSLDGSTVTLNGSAMGWMGESPIGNSETFADAITINGTGGEYQLVELGDIHFPVTQASGGPLSRTQIDVSVTSSDFDNVFKFDEIFLLNLSTGQFTRLNADLGEGVPGGPSNRLWIDSPDISNDGQPEIWRGHAEDRSDAVAAWIYAKAVDIHEFDPQYDVTTFLITLGTSTQPAVRFHYYPAFWYRAYLIEP